MPTQVSLFSIQELHKLSLCYPHVLMQTSKSDNKRPNDSTSPEEPSPSTSPSTTRLTTESSRDSFSTLYGNLPGLLDEALMSSGPFQCIVGRNKTGRLYLDLNLRGKHLRLQSPSGSNTRSGLLPSLNQMLNPSIVSTLVSTPNLQDWDIVLETQGSH